MFDDNEEFNDEQNACVSTTTKTAKPLMEKRRRARINECLSQLKLMILGEHLQRKNPKLCKLDKAAILELTVDHLNIIRRTAATTTAHGRSEFLSNKYKIGFNECASEVCRYLGEIECIDPEIRMRLLDHLASVIQNLNFNSNKSLRNSLDQRRNISMPYDISNRPRNNRQVCKPEGSPSGPVWRPW